MKVGYGAGSWQNAEHLQCTSSAASCFLVGNWAFSSIPACDGDNDDDGIPVRTGCVLVRIMRRILLIRASFKTCSSFVIENDKWCSHRKDSSARHYLCKPELTATRESHREGNAIGVLMPASLLTSFFFFSYQAWACGNGGVLAPAWFVGLR